MDNNKIAIFEEKCEILSSLCGYDYIGFYEYLRRIFERTSRDMQEKGVDHYWDNRYNCIVMCLGKSSKNEGKKSGKNFIFTRGFSELGEDKFDLAKSMSELVITSPILYVGRNRTAKNSRVCYGIAIDVDGVDSKRLKDIIHQQDTGYIPKSNIITNSGTGVHLYFLLKEPIALFDNIKPVLDKLKHGLTNRCWNSWTSSIKKKQFQGIFQGFRVPQSLTKFGVYTCAYADNRGEKGYYTLDELNDFISEDKQLSSEELALLAKAVYKHKDNDRLTLEEAAKLYPDWYERRIIKKQSLGRPRWNIKRALYDWWLRKMRSADEVIEGHRYFCIMVLAMYALKCNVSYEELEKDALSLVDKFDAKTNDLDNHFAEDDVYDALKAYKECYVTFPRETMVKLTAIPMPVNKRNNRGRRTHLMVARSVQNTLCLVEGRDWRKGNGRPKGSVIKPETSSHAKIVREWREKNPESNNKSLCARETNLSRPTVIKWWGEHENYKEVMLASQGEHNGLFGEDLT